VQHSFYCLLVVYDGILFILVADKLAHVKLNPGLPWQKLHSARRRLFLPANWT